MRAFAFAIALTGWVMLASCESYNASDALPGPPPGFERTETGSGCRDTATGEDVDADKCDPFEQ